MIPALALLAAAILATRPPPVTDADCKVLQPAYVCPGDPIAMLWCHHAKFFVVDADGRRRPMRDSDRPAGYQVLGENDPPPTCPIHPPPISPGGHSARKP